MAVNVNGVALDPNGDMVVAAAAARGHGARLGFEPLAFARWCDLARPGVTMVDAGAYSGIYAIAAARRGADVVAFEPNPAAAVRAEENFIANGVAGGGGAPVLHPVALWSRFDVLKLSGAAPMTSASSVVRHKGPPRSVVGAPLDAFRLERVAAIKIDVERAEVEVVRGAMDTIRRNRPVVLAEVLDAEIGEAIDGLIGPLGYTRDPLDRAMFAWTA